MSLDTVGTALIRRHIGRRLTALREQAGLTQEQAAQRLEKGRSTIIRMEDGADNVRFRDIDVKAMLTVYGASDADSEVVLALTAETRNGRKKGWWHDYTATQLPEWFGLYVILEDSAVAIREYESELIPGLLQTPEYAETLMKTQPAAIPAGQIEHHVQVRMERQRILSRDKPTKLDVVLNEAIVHRPVGNGDVMASQLRHLLDMARKPNITIRILPWAAGEHGGMAAGNSFMLLDFPKDPSGQPIEPSLAYVDTLTGAMYLNKADEFAAYQVVWRDVKNKSLSAAESASFISAALEGISQ